MEVRFRPGGLTPPLDEVEEVYQRIRDDDGVCIASDALMQRIRLGVKANELTRVVTVSAYDKKGFKVTSEIMKNGSFSNDEIVRYISPTDEEWSNNEQ